MKAKFFFLSLIGMFLVGSILAQTPKIKFQVGYGIPLINSPQWSSQANGSVSIHSFSLGSGLRIETGIVQPLRKNLAVQLDLAYLSGKRNSTQQLSNSNYSNNSFYSNFYDITPMLRFTLDEFKVKPYLAFGPAFGFGKFYRENENGALPAGSGITYTSRREFKGSFALGTKTELGVQFQFGKITYYTQLTALNMRYTPTSSELTSYNVNSTSQLSNLTVSQKKAVYVDTIDIGATQDPNQPTKTLKTTFPFDSISLNVGILLSF